MPTVFCVAFCASAVVSDAIHVSSTGGEGAGGQCSIVDIHRRWRQAQTLIPWRDYDVHIGDILQRMSRGLFLSLLFSTAAPSLPISDVAQVSRVFVSGSSRPSLSSSSRSKTLQIESDACLPPPLT